MEILQGQVRCACGKYHHGILDEYLVSLYIYLSLMSHTGNVKVLQAHYAQAWSDLAVLPIMGQSLASLLVFAIDSSFTVLNSAVSARLCLL